MTEVVSIRFKDRGKLYFFAPGGHKVKAGDAVIVETAKGQEYAEVTKGNHKVENEKVVAPLRKILRIATEEDRERASQNREKEAEAFRICKEKITEHGLEMKLVDVEYSFDGTKILFFFSAEGRVDFRNLVRDLAGIFRTRIELRQIGVRDEAKLLGGFGVCGKPFCCATFLSEFQPVSIKMAKTQALSLNPVKISGICGRLMCCLKYEQEAYEDLLKKAPKNDAYVLTPAGKGVVTNVNLLRQQVKVRLDAEGEPQIKQFSLSEIELTQRSGGKEATPKAKSVGKAAKSSAPALPAATAEKPAKKPVRNSDGGKKPNPQKRNRNRTEKKPPKTEK